MAERGKEESGDEHDHPGRDGHLSEQDLREDTAGPVNPHAFDLCLPPAWNPKIRFALCERNVNVAAASD
ncbi:hypothetical protein GCM10018966_014720 [Streptomyces yanii]